MAPQRLGELTSTDVGEGRWRLLVPVGSCEQHGPHLPLDTDTRIASAVCDAVAARRPRVVVAPAVSIGASGEHAGFPGSLSIGTEALTTVLVELVRSADHFSGVLLVNAHGGNRTALDAAADGWRSEGRRACVHHVGFPAGDAHAGRTETSIMLALAPELVRQDRAEAGDPTPIDELMPRLRSEGLAAVSPNGVLGDPAGATGDEGRRLLAQATAAALDALSRLDEPAHLG